MRFNAYPGYIQGLRARDTDPQQFQSRIRIQTKQGQIVHRSEAVDKEDKRRRNRQKDKRLTKTRQKINYKVTHNLFFNNREQNLWLKLGKVKGARTQTNVLKKNCLNIETAILACPYPAPCHGRHPDPDQYLLHP